MDWKLEVIVLPVSDVDRAKQFYGEQVGFVVDHDVRPSENFRIVQLTPRGSGCSIVLGPECGAPGSVKGLQLVVTDVEAARAELAGRGVDVTPVRHMDNGTWVDRPGGIWNSFIFFHDPDGNSWTVQQGPSPE